MTTRGTPSLVVMAAGLGSRFGGLKQLEPVGPRGEAILDFTIRDAAAAGVGRIVVIVRREIHAEIRAHVEATVGALPRPPALVLVNQDETPPPRAKPWGTVHAVLSVAPVVDGPFVLVNADDYYGEAIALAARELTTVDARTALLVAFQLDHTVPRHGAVSRGVCDVDGDTLVRLVETHHVARRHDGAIRLDDGAGAALDPATPVSMNLWGFDPAIFAQLQPRFDAFVAAHGASESTECLLPNEVAALVAAGALRVRVVRSTATWTGITNRQDLDDVRARLAALDG